MTKTFNASDSGVPFLRDRNISRRGLLGGALGTAAAVGLAACGAGSAGAPGQVQSAPGGGGAEALGALGGALQRGGGGQDRRDGDGRDGTAPTAQ